MLAVSAKLHEFTLGELMLGSISRDAQILKDLQKVPRVHAVSHDHAVAFVQANRLEGSGIGWVDAHLLASAQVEDAGIWTTDKALAAAANRIGIPITT